MNIKEIAKLAGVSPSTVSKIINGKDENLNSETRNRVLKIVKEYNYTPYASVMKSTQCKTFSIAVLLKGCLETCHYLNGFFKEAQAHGYHIVLYCSHHSLEAELKNITSLCSKSVDGVIWEKVSSESCIYEKYLKDAKIPFLCLGESHTRSMPRIDFYKIGNELTEKLLEARHSNIAFVYDKWDQVTEKLFEGFQSCLISNQIPYSDYMKLESSPLVQYKNLILDGFTAAVCTDRSIALSIIQQLEEVLFAVPKDFSLVCLQNGTASQNNYPKLSSYPIPYEEYGQALCRHLIHRLEKNDENSIFIHSPIMIGNDSVDIPYTAKRKKIVVVGSIHMDIILTVDETPQTGKSISANHCTTLPGGKGINQAIGASKLGGEVSLIGKVGNDYEGTLIYKALGEYHVDIQGISRDPSNCTGKACIHVQDDGESSITIYSGANSRLTPSDIDMNQQLFRNAGFCLLSSELPMDTLERAAVTAKRYGAQVILKPAAIHNLSGQLLSITDYLVPNKKEIDLLCPFSTCLEEQAKSFLKKNVKNVIVTLGHKGCFFTNGSIAKYYPPSNFQPVDTTGGADAFVSALAVFLLENHPIHQAIQYASCAAGFCISRQSVIPALIDRTSLEMYIKKGIDTVLSVPDSSASVIY